MQHIEIYDTTLRDGTQGEGVSLSLVDKLRITERLDALGVDFIEGGYPLSNPKDAAYFEEVRKLKLRHAKVCAFGMTRRKGMKPADDPGMKSLLDAQTPVVTIVGKTWDLHVDEVLQISRDENLAMIRETVAHLRAAGRDVFYDAEHFFDGYRGNPDYALQTLKAALEGGATRLVLCDTNGGSLPQWVTRVVGELRNRLGSVSSLKPHATSLLLGIHVHNDGGLAVANSLAAIEAGCVQVQGTINGIGERCGNVDLTTVVANLRLKLNDRFTCLRDDALTHLTEVSRYVYERANLNLVAGQPYVGASAFAHKGGMHVHAVQKVAHSYEHVAPESVGNTRKILVSELSGASNIAATLGKKFNIAADKNAQRKVLERLQDLEHQGYQYESAVASFELLVRDVLGKRPAFWELEHYRCEILRYSGAPSATEAIVKLRVNGKTEHQVAEGDGPVNALDGALRRCLTPHFPSLSRVHLRDFKVRVVNPTAESAAKVRVISEFVVHQDDTSDASAKPVGDATLGNYFATIGVNENIVDASWQALTDAFAYFLIEQAKA